MVDSVRRNPDMRDQLKCSECRRKKIKCTPRNRQWEITHQKCDNCKKHDDAPCGPSYKKKDDPTLSGSHDEVTTQEEYSNLGAEDEQRPPNLQPAGAHADGHHADQPPPVAEEFEGQRKRKIASDKEPEELHEEARVLLSRLNSLARPFDFGSQLTPVNCHNPDNAIEYKQPGDKIKAMGDKLHSLFMETCQLGLQLHERGHTGDADRIFMRLVVALDEYPGLGDDRKFGALWNMAKVYLDTGYQDEHERVLEKAAEIHNPLVHQKNPCPLLKSSLIETSRSACHELRNFWDNHYMEPAETPLAIPPIQRSAQHKNPGVGSTLLARPNSAALSPPALFNLEGLHVAAIRGYEQNLKYLLRAGAQVDAVDVFNHTALFLAAAKGHEGCCAELIRNGANVNSRDLHGTTILEVAAGAGHIKVVQRLVDAGAEVNSEFVCCTSSPLQAAIENPESPLEVALYLMGKGGNVTIPRRDGKNAIGLAEERCSFLAEIMRQNQLQGPQLPFHAYTFDHRHLDFAPGSL